MAMDDSAEDRCFLSSPNPLRARPRYVRFGQHVRYRLSDLSLRKEPIRPS